MEKYSNSLVKESSLYLQQHAHNPVNWEAWSTEAFAKAERENKLVLVSIGYSACHWCHVMEHECFEDEEVATLMNKFFVCIKVDREERPDVDQVYMNAVQLMTQRGGWPLNCFTISNGQPVYGGTYFPKDQWMHVLKSLAHTFANDPEKVVEYAKELTEGVQRSELIPTAQAISKFPSDKLSELVHKWKSRFDLEDGGPNHAPKFPLPNNYEFLLHYGAHTKDENLLNYVHLTLHKMALGGIYDQLGGGFARYSVDELWKVPHFEKMLYDNGQLLSLYALGFQHTNEPEYKRVLDQTYEWLKREMQSSEGGLFAAQDADSEGVEGKYYCFAPSEIHSILGEDAGWFLDLYNPSDKGYWEHDMWILLRDKTLEHFIQSNPTLTVEKIQATIEKLLAHRIKRVHPVTDTKCLTAWNAMTINGLVAAFRATNDEKFSVLALEIAEWIKEFQLTSDNKLWHTRQNNRSFIDGFLDDYSFTIQAFIAVYELTANECWLETALYLQQTADQYFYDGNSGMYFFTSTETELIARKMEINDNVIPATNGVMAHNLLSFFQLTDNMEHERKAKQLLQNIIDGMEQYGSGYSNWALLLLRFQKGVSCIHTPSNEAIFQVELSPFVQVKYTEDSAFTVCSQGMCSRQMTDTTEVIRYLRQLNG